VWRSLEKKPVTRSLLEQTKSLHRWCSFKRTVRRGSSRRASGATPLRGGSLPSAFTRNDLPPLTAVDWRHHCGTALSGSHQPLVTRSGIGLMGAIRGTGSEWGRVPSGAGRRLDAWEARAGRLGSSSQAGQAKAGQAETAPQNAPTAHSKSRRGIGPAGDRAARPQRQGPRDDGRARPDAAFRRVLENIRTLDLAA
jgi:hypothetical protein